MRREKKETEDFRQPRKRFSFRATDAWAEALPLRHFSKKAFVEELLRDVLVVDGLGGKRSAGYGRAAGSLVHEPAAQ
jgi:hypothetical protein